MCRQLRCQLRAIGADHEASTVGPDGPDGPDELARLMEQLRVMTTQRDQAVAALERAEDRALAASRAETRRHNQALRVANLRGGAREERLRGGRREAQRQGSSERTDGGMYPPFVYKPAPKAATYSVAATTHRVYLDAEGRIGRCAWKDVHERLTIRIDDPTMDEHSRPSFELFVGGLTSAPSERFNTDTVTVLDARGTRQTVRAPSGNGASTYELVAPDWRRGSGSHEWLAEFRMTIAQDSGSLGGAHVNLELGVRPLDAPTNARFETMVGGNNVQVKFETENPLVGAVSVSVRTLAHGPKPLKQKIVDGDRNAIGYNTNSVYSAMRDRAKASTVADAAM